MGACSPRKILNNMSDFLFSRDKFTIHTRPIKLYSSFFYSMSGPNLTRIGYLGSIKVVSSEKNET